MENEDIKKCIPQYNNFHTASASTADSAEGNF